MPARRIAAAADSASCSSRTAPRWSATAPSTRAVMVISVPGLAFICIDSTDGPAWADAVGGEVGPDGIWQPPIISRAAWGANETYRLDGDGMAEWPTSIRRSSTSSSTTP